MNFYFHSRAEEEFDEAVRYYEEHEVGLGLEFAGEIYAAIKRIAEYPNAWTPMSENTRCCLVSRFPYRIIYQIKNNGLRILAVACLHRQPDYWRTRR
ncbi:MAG TPA: type II toxin-antitoxin system RelE/ParE family toxin [Candidatus Hydrogenedentes bacterium]|jgi:plasmid stabilization system protein ParE|nr:MAG: Plasmid stabilization system protein [Candidatus Hydrogenedentes bacterium ADurb.Bin101]HOC68304.1 type II toxin-antitoxin system RelE/ParE family toxin [Candidatus Hydrogenedentota bacterium]HQN01053.1 type II toxin-antitoxin system RelE/ParE family toxin [Candidatus Hydrogenedentota bacterium]